MRSLLYATVVIAYMVLGVYLIRIATWRKLWQVRNVWTSLRQNDDPLRPKARELMSTRRLHRARVGSGIASHFLALFVVVTLVQLHAREDVWFENDQTAWTVLAEWELVAAVFGLLATAVVGFFPWIITPRTMDALFTVIMARLAVREILSPNIMLQYYYIGFVGGQRLVLLILLGNMRFAMAGNVAFSCCNQILFAYNFGWDPGHTTYESINLVGLLAMAWIIHVWTYSEARSTLEAKLSARTEATMHRLLSAMCDAVVHLGPKLTIRYPAPKLQVLLLKSTVTQLQGTLFTDLLDHSERDRFGEFLSLMIKEPPGHELEDEETVACSLHSHMKDSCNVKVPVQIFHGTYLDINEQVSHIVGIRADQEISAFEHFAQEPPALNNSGGPLLTGDGPTTDHTSSISSSAPDVEHTEEVAAWVNTSTPQYRVVKSTAGFSALCGPSTDDIELGAWLSRGQRKKFRAWIQEAFSNFYHECETLDNSSKIELKLAPPNLERFKVSVVTTIELLEIELSNNELSNNEDSETSNQAVFMLLSFSDIEWIQGKNLCGSNALRKAKRLQKS